jgi:hypothetical protein
VQENVAGEIGVSSDQIELPRGEHYEIAVSRDRAANDRGCVTAAALRTVRAQIDPLRGAKHPIPHEQIDVVVVVARDQISGNAEKQHVAAIVAEAGLTAAFDSAASRRLEAEKIRVCIG